MTTNAAPLAISVDEVARRTSLSTWTVREAIRKGQIPSVRIGKRVLVPVAALEAMFAVERAS